MPWPEVSLTAPRMRLTGNVALLNYLTYYLLPVERPWCAGDAIPMNDDYYLFLTVHCALQCAHI